MPPINHQVCESLHYNKEMNLARDPILAPGIRRRFRCGFTLVEVCWW